MKNCFGQRRGRFSPRGRPFLFVGFSALLLLAGCQSSKFDLRRLEQPVIANTNPFLGPPNSCGLNVVPVADYGAEVGQSHVAAGDSSQVQVANQAQVQAFQLIGGDTNRTIREVELDIKFTAVNALVALAESISLQATGKVVELRPAAGTNGIATGGVQ